MKRLRGMGSVSEEVYQRKKFKVEDGWREERRAGLSVASLNEATFGLQCYVNTENVELPYRVLVNIVKKREDEINEECGMRVRCGGEKKEEYI